MAKTTIGLGFMRTPEQEARMQRAGDRLPDDWTVTAVGNSTSGIFDVRVVGPGVVLSQTFRPDDAEEAIAWLEGIRLRK